jgi:anti-sigma B factor antagonist
LLNVGKARYGMQVWFSPSRRVAVVEPEGELDLSRAGALRQALLRAHEAENLIVADFARVRFVDSTTVGVLVGAWKRARAANKQLVVSHAHGPALRVFQLLGVHDLLVVPPAAVRAPKQPPQVAQRQQAPQRRLLPQLQH